AVPHIFDYSLVDKKDSMPNTPPTFSWYMAGLTFKWCLEQGGLEEMARRTQKRADTLYDYVLASDFYKPRVTGSNRSMINVVFDLVDPSLDEAFLSYTDERGLRFLKGHRVVGGMRASLYNAVTEPAVDALIAFMLDFEQRNG
ncbi:MAG: aminotransferase class V-fold PLP-dependent enzyme, partial [Halioglobus sp.]|nr:aminotransferase class V-fold PLP-dependent enzyme [Halioglobus sp.]